MPEFITKHPVQTATISMDLAVLEYKASEILADILFLKEARDHGHDISLDEIRDIEGKSKFLASMVGIVRMKIQTRPTA
jgi:hypothetical protein